MLLLKSYVIDWSATGDLVNIIIAMLSLAVSFWLACLVKSQLSKAIDANRGAAFGILHNIEESLRDINNDLTEKIIDLNGEPTEEQFNEYAVKIEEIFMCMNKIFRLVKTGLILEEMIKTEYHEKIKDVFAIAVRLRVSCKQHLTTLSYLDQICKDWKIDTPECMHPSIEPDQKQEGAPK